MYQAVIGGQCCGLLRGHPHHDHASIKDERLLTLKVVEGTARMTAPTTAWPSSTSENRAFLDLFNEGLANIKANGTYDKIHCQVSGLI